MSSDSSGAASRQLLGRGSIYTLATAAPVLAGIALLPITTRLLSPDEYGVVALCLVIIQFGSILASLGLTISVTRHAVLETSGLSGARALVVTSIPLAVVVASITLVTGRWWSGILLGQPWQIAMAFAVFAAAAAAVVANVQAFLRATDKAWLFVLLAAGGTLLGPAIGVFVLLIGDRRPASYVLCLAGGYGVAAIIGLAVILSGGPLRFRVQEALRAIRIGLPTIPHSLALSLSTGGMVLIAGTYLGLAGSASLQVALFVGALPVVVTSAVNNAWAPLVMRAAESDRAVVVTRTSADIGWLAACAGGGIAFLAPFILRLVAPASYLQTDMARVAPVVSVTAVVSVIYLANSHLIYVSGRTSGLAICTPVSVAVGITSAIALVGPLGLVGAGAGFLITYATLALTTYFLARKVSVVRWSPLVMLAPLFFAVCCAALSLFLPVEGNGAYIIRISLSIAVVLVALGVIIRVVKRR